MTITAIADALLARSSLYGGGRGSTNGTVYLLLGLGAVALLFVGIAYLDKLRRSRATRGESSTDSLFGELCRVHNLGRGDRSLIAEAAQLQNVEQREHLFVDPRIWQSLADSHSTRAAEFNGLKTRLFGSPSSDE